MCWSETSSIAMVGLGAAATAVTAMRGEQRAIWLTLGYFTAMEALQVAGYAVVDQCGDPANRAVTQLSYLHIALQPLFINAFAMAIAPAPVSLRMRRWVFVAAAAASALMLLRLAPVEWFGPCRPDDIMCAGAYCTYSGNWHIAWQVPLNGLYNAASNLLGSSVGYPDYFLAVFALPLIYGAWRFVVFHLAVGPVLAWALTSNPDEVPAVWCLFSIGIILISLSPYIRHNVMGAHRPATA